VKRADLKRQCIPVRKGNPFGKPDLSRIEQKERAVLVKDVGGKPFIFRWTLGLWLIQKEWKIYSLLAGIRGIPQPIERIDRFAFAVEWIEGKPIDRGEPLPTDFFQNLERVLSDFHSRGVAHLDIRHKGNILVSERGEPYLIDFNSSFSFIEKGWLRRYFFPFLQWVDHGGFLKLKQRVSPGTMTPQDVTFLRRFNRLRKLWIFN
jgi:hypothetical protein